MGTEFVDRKQELNELEARWRSGRAELFVVYGRRRVGKTELLLQFARNGKKNKRVLYFLGTQVTRQEHLRQFTALLRDTFTDSLLETLDFTEWESVFTYLAKQAEEERLLVVLDEFPYLCEASPELPSVLQRFWDLRGRETRLFLVLCGSQLGFMEREILGEQAPLYGRRTGQLHLYPLSFRAAARFFPDYTPRGKFTAYGILGGMPAYLRRFVPARPIHENLLQEMLQVQGYLYEEPHFLLRMELRDPKVYASLLGAIASGCTKLNEIAQRAGLTVQAASKYLGVLRELGLVAREVPLTARAPHRSKRGRYRLLDPYLAFWFRFVQPYASLIEAGHGELVYRRFIAPSLNEYLGGIFERVVREYLRLDGSSELGLAPILRVGRHWEADFDIDAMAEHADGSWSVGECKWTHRPIGISVLRKLQENVQRLSKSFHLSGEVRYLLFSSGGFTKKLQETARNKNILLISLEDLLGKE